MYHLSLGTSLPLLCMWLLGLSLDERRRLNGMVKNCMKKVNNVKHGCYYDKMIENSKFHLKVETINLLKDYKFDYGPASIKIMDLPTDLHQVRSYIL
ncbi:hypothetical protein TrispH2_010161 [Trichoplax sp. H2]|nr:hypothetical protein TrispH2_010161 [Trichoplax sp. H2]|eukprot:RDD38021.1 hypothetical protein TrispH2_010161 [Trichoplax sp. H2]